MARRPPPAFKGRTAFQRDDPLIPGVNREILHGQGVSDLSMVSPEFRVGRSRKIGGCPYFPGLWVYSIRFPLASTWAMSRPLASYSLRMAEWPSGSMIWVR